MSQFPPPFPQQPPIQSPQRQQFQVPAPSGSGAEYQSWQQSTQPQSIPPYPYPPELPRQPMPPAPKPKHHLRKLWIVVALVVVVLFAAIAGIFHAHQNPAPASTTQVKVTQPSNQPTQPVDHPTAHPTSAPAQPGASTTPAILGADLSTFITKYGQVIQVQGGYYTFKTGGIEMMAGNDPPPYATRALAIVYNAPNGRLLSINDATNACVALSPSDAYYQYSLTLTGARNQIVGVERVYFSASLAKQFPASEFVDGHLKATKPGTFGIMLNYGPGSTTQVASCSTQVSLQGN